MPASRKFAAAIVALLCHGASAAEPCSAECLRTQLDGYVAALVRQDVGAVKTTNSLRFTENGQTLQLGEGLWRTATAPGAYRHEFVDPVSQQAMYYGAIEEGTGTALVTLRIAVKDNRIAEIEHIVARTGSHPLFAPQALTTPHPSLSAPVARPLLRDELIRIADTYMEGIEQHTSRIILASDSCQRIENGVQTTNQPNRGSRNCAHSADLLTYIESVDERRFPIVDPTHGIVVSTFIFRIPGDVATSQAAIGSNVQVAARLREPRTLLLTEWFKIDDGKIQHIEAIMHNLPPGSGSGWE